MKNTGPLVLVLVALPACNSPSGSPGADTNADADADADAGTAPTGATSADSTTDADPTTGQPPTTATTTTTGGDETGPTYYRDAKPIFDRKCVMCHQPENIAPFSLQTYDEVSTFAQIIVPAITNRIMPPWPPGADCTSYKHDRSLTDEELATLLAWVDAGAHEGDPADAPAPPEPEPPIAYDIELGIPEPYTPSLDVNDDYRCFLLDWPKDQPSYVTGLTIEPGDRQIVHHVIAYLVPPDEVPLYQALDDGDPGPGYPCFGGPSGEATPKAQWLGAWVPGSANGELPEGTGILVKPGSKIALQMHYHPIGVELSDQSTLKARTAEDVERIAFLLPIANPGWPINTPPMLIPPNAPDTLHAFAMNIDTIMGWVYAEEGLYTLPMLLHSASLHMHTHASSGKLGKLGVDSACLLDVPRWDFNWQGIYELEEPVPISPTLDQIYLECHYDNTGNENAILWGEGTEDEMCLGVFYVSTPKIFP